MLCRSLVKRFEKCAECHYLATRTLFSSSPTTVVYSWGDGSRGQLGHLKYEKTMGVMDEEYVQVEPRKMVKSKRFTRIAAGDGISLGVTKEGELLGWGNKEQLNKPSDVKEPILINTEKKILKVSAGSKHFAAIDIDGGLWTWGYGGGWLKGGGQLGHNDKASHKQPKLVHALKEYGARAASVSCGGHHTMVLTEEGEVMTCGVGEYGRLGTGSQSDCAVPMPVEFLEDKGVVQIAAGHDHSLALTKEGALYSWGKNQSGQLGHSDSMLDIYSMEDYPRLVDELGAAVKYTRVAAGNSRSAAITADGKLYVWGARISNVPTLVDPSKLWGEQRVVKVSCGGDAGSAVIAIVVEDGTLWTMGDAKSAMLGADKKSIWSGKRALPEQVEGSLKGKRVVDVSCGFGRHMFAFVVADEES